MTKSGYFVACSGGNDSVALIQYMIDRGLCFDVVYNNTGWAVDWWPKRMNLIRQWIEQHGNAYHETMSEGMKDMIRRKGGWPKPASNMQFCTGELKEQPSLRLYAEIDPNCEFDVVTGRRRVESRNRADLPEWGYNSPKHGGRDVWNPLVRYSDADRDALLAKTNIPKLSTQSLECYPCICANKTSGVLSNLPESRIKEIEDFELSLGKNGKGNPRTMFRPKRCGGAVGIRQVVQWAKGKRGWKADEVPKEYKNLPTIIGGEEIEECEQSDMFVCSGGFCSD